MRMIYSRKVLFIILINGFFLSFYSTVKSAEAGKVLFVYGSGKIMDSALNSRALEKGSIINPGDQVITENNTRAQLKMNDGSFFSLRPNTHFKIKEFEYAKKDTDKSFFGLLRGGFRAITGLIGKRNRSAYSMTTPVATIGIRGTHYTALLCQQGDCDSEGGINDGLYVGVAEGEITLTNASGIININPQQFGYVQGSLSSPSLLPTPPESLINESSGSSRAARKNIVDDQNDEKSEESNNEEKKKQQTVKNDSSEESEKPKKVEANGNNGESLNLVEKVAEKEIIDLTIGANSPLAVSTNSVGGITNSNSAASVVLNQDNNTLTLFSSDAQNFSQLTTIDTGYDSTSGLAWGRWKGGNVENIDGSSPTEIEDINLHWAIGPKVTMPSSGAATYNLAGGTAPTDGSGNVGILGLANLEADFVGNTVNTDIIVGLGNNIWQATGSSDSISNASFTGDLTGTITNVITTGTVSIGVDSTFNGAFTGQNASGSVMSYSIQGNPDGVPTTLNGSLAFTKK